MSSYIVLYTMNAAKKKIVSINENKQYHRQPDSVLLPGLPNHLAHLCLATSPPSLLYRVCMSWRRFIYSPDFPPFFSLYALLAPKKSVKDQCTSHSIGFFSFDTIACKWRPLPTPPSNPPLCMLTRHPSFISRILPVQSVTALGRLVLVAANTHDFLPALNRPLIFDPLSSNWSFGPPLSTPRRWCVTGSMDGSIYVASGMGARYHIDIARSVERWDLLEKETGWKWKKRAELRDGRFSREAIEAVGYRGKLCMVNVKGRAVKEGAVLDVASDEWEEIGKGMVGGWNGPAGVDDRGVIYVVDQERGSLSKYNGDDDCWEELIEHSEHLKGAEQISAGRGRVCAVSGDGGKIVVVDVSGRPPNVWTLDPPQGMEAVAVHILPRMTDQSSHCNANN
ncbi:hypothetical protein ACS0TY_003380 [Phlomoides rotata]